MTMTKAHAWFLAAAIPLFAACSHAKAVTKTEPPMSTPPIAEATPAEPAAPAPVPPAATPTCSADDQCGATELCISSKCAAITPELAECRKVSAHFDFDRYTLHPADLPALQREARCLEALPAEPTLVSGNCDERGTVAYNIVLGLRRAHTVARYLERLGVPEQRLTEVSYGKELGICSAENERCWSMNRRTDVARGEKARDVAALIRADEQKERAAMAEARPVARKPAAAFGRRAALPRRPGTRAAPGETAPAR